MKCFFRIRCFCCRISIKSQNCHTPTNIYPTGHHRCSRVTTSWCVPLANDRQDGDGFSGGDRNEENVCVYAKIFHRRVSPRRRVGGRVVTNARWAREKPADYRAVWSLLFANATRALRAPRDDKGTSSPSYGKLLGSEKRREHKEKIERTKTV